VRSIAMSMSVCPSASLFAHISRKPHGRTLTNLLCMLPVTVAQSFSDGVVIRYLLPVLWMTSGFHSVGSVMRLVNFYVARA